MIRDPNESPLDLAVRKLDRALLALEQKLAVRVGPADNLFDQDKVLLAAELERARERERQLEEAGSAASLALGRAIDEIRSALDDAQAPEAAGE